MRIMQYRKLSDEYTTHELRLPEADGEALGQELCTIDGTTFTVVSGDQDLPKQPETLVISEITLTPELRAAIKAASPACRLIKTRAHEMIADVYSIEDQRMVERMSIAGFAGLKTLSEDQKAVIAHFSALNDKALAWAAEQYAALGL